MEKPGCSKNPTQSGNVSGSRQAEKNRFRCDSIHIKCNSIMREDKQEKQMAKNDLLVTTLSLGTKQYNTSSSNNKTLLHNTVS
jgi:hypothetical protein